MKLFIDANLMLDLLLKRETDGYFNEMLTLIDFANDGKIFMFCSSANFFFLEYILKKELGIGKTVEVLRDILAYIKPAPTTKKNILDGLNSAFKDKEDSFQYFTALNLKGISYFLTGNVKDFKSVRDANIPVITPKDFLKKLNP